MTLLKSTTRREWLTYLVVWLFMFLAPLVSLYVQSRLNSGINFRMGDVLHMWEGLVVMLAAFIVHNHWLAPRLLYRRRTLTYVVGVVVLTAVFVTVECTRRPAGPPPEVAAAHHAPPAARGHHGPPPAGEARPDLPTPPPDGGRPFDPNNMMSTVLMLMVFAANLGVKYMFKAADDNRKRQTLEQEGLRQELAYLKYQLNPHFFMNTLNNIHALVDIDPDKAKLCIVELSRMMRYIIYECNKDTVPLARGIAVIENYMALMRIRYDDQVEIRLDVPAVTPSIELPPLLIIPFVENAFKHGVSYAKQSFIHVSIAVEDGRLRLVCHNSKHSDDTEHGGLGLANVTKRLDLIYGDSYTLAIDDRTDDYTVTLTVPVNS